MVADGSLMMMRPPSLDVLPRFECGASSLWTRRPQRELRRSSSSPPSLCSPSSSSSAPLSVVEFPRLTYSSHAAPSAVVDAFRPGRFAVGIEPRSAPSSARPPHAATTETAGDGEGLKWWERYGAPNMFDVHSAQQFVDALAAAGDKLVVVEFFASWCPSCRALFPKFCKMAAENSDMYFLKVNFDENKPMCKRLNVKVLPFFHIYRGAEGRLDSFSCSLSKLQRLRDAIAKHHDGTCEDCAPPELIGDALDSLLEKKPLDQPAAAGRSSE